MSTLIEKHCAACEGGVESLNSVAVNDLLKKVDGWQASDDHKQISKRFQFKNFYRTMAFVNAIAWIANRENHHPDLAVGYDYCEVAWTTHAIDGLSENDFICAAKIDQMAAL